MPNIITHLRVAMYVFLSVFIVTYNLHVTHILYEMQAFKI